MRCQCGFSLIEILLVMSIFSIGILAIMTLHVSAISSNTRARAILMGSTLLADQFEKLISADDPSAGLAPEEAATHAENGLVVERTVATTPIPQIKRIDLTVTLDAFSGRAYKVIYYKRNPG
jgi:prepilin-type N-terminal cleavage/methylation domain-containing protein